MTTEDRREQLAQARAKRWQPKEPETAEAKPQAYILFRQDTNEQIAVAPSYEEMWAKAEQITGQTKQQLLKTHVFDVG